MGEMLDRINSNLFEDSISNEGEDEYEKTKNFGLTIFDSDTDESSMESRMDVTYLYEKTEDNSICWIFTFSDTGIDCDYDEDDSTRSVSI